MVDSFLVRIVTWFALISSFLYSAGSPVREISRAFEMIVKLKSTKCARLLAKPIAVQGSIMLEGGLQAANLV